MAHIALYYRPTCPFCRKVLNFLEDNNRTVSLRDIGQNLQYREELIQKGGKQQVPCLLIDDKPLYESDDIIQWLKDHSD